MRTVQRHPTETVENQILASLDQATELLANIDRRDVDEVDAVAAIEELRSFHGKSWDVVDQYGFDCAVQEVPRHERAVISIEPCPVCGETTAEPRFSIARLPYRVVVCNDCGLGQLHPAPSATAVASFYPAEYYGTSGAKFKPLVEAMVRVVGSRHVKSLAKGLRPGARVLDVGCGRGVLLSALADRGFEAHGFEISETAADGADARAKIRIASDLRQARYPDAFFDEVIVWHVLEHLTNPRETLLEIRRILRPGGRLVVSVPNFSSLQSRWAGSAWFHLDLPRHLFHFPVDALRRLIGDCGFNWESEHHFSLRQNPFGWVQSGLNRCRSLPRNGLYRMLKNSFDEKPAGGLTIRWTQMAAYYLGMPFALALSIVEAALGSGGSVCIMAEADESGQHSNWVEPSITSL